MTSPERQLEEELIEKLRGLKYEYRTEIQDRATLEKNFREKFEALNRVHLTEGEFQRLLDEIITPDVFLLINGVPVVQIELKSLGINPRRAIERIVDYKNDPGNAYTRTLLCFVQLFVLHLPRKRLQSGMTPRGYA